MAIYFITKWALSGGIIKADVPVVANGEYVRTSSGALAKIGRDAFGAQSDAEDDVAKQLRARATSLEKQLTKIRSMAARDAALKIEDRTITNG